MELTRFDQGSLSSSAGLVTTGAFRGYVGSVAWLVRDGEVLASVELADGRAARRRGLLGRDDFDGVLRLKARSVHTIGMRFGIDVAFCDPDGTVRRMVTMKPGRISRPELRSTIVFEARADTFREWNLRPGDCLEVR